MPFHLREDGKPVVAFDPRLEISPFGLFRSLDEGRELLLVDIRAPGVGGKTLKGAERLAGDAWQPPGVEPGTKLAPPRLENGEVIPAHPVEE